MTFGLFARSLGITGVLLASLPTGAGAEPRHGASMYGELKYGPGFQHFEYASPEAVKGGEVVFSAIGSFDSLNPYILKGRPGAGVGLVFETLTTQSLDEPFSEYGLIAETIDMPEDRSSVTFTLRPEARWHDGEPITVDDVVFSLETLKADGHPFYKAYYANVVSAEASGERSVTFNFDGELNRELPLIIGQMPILPQHYYQEVAFNETTLTPPLGSGPYRITEVDPGRSIELTRVEDYWGADLPVNTGRNNFDKIRYEYYRDSNVALEAFKAGEYDIRAENVAKNWATAYEDGPFADGRAVKAEIPREGGTGMQGFVFNTRRDKFADPLVREALAYAFDFEWTNKTLFYGAYTRTESYFSNSELASEGLPGEGELELLEPFRGQIPDEVFTAEYNPPETDGSGNIRGNLREAFRLLREAGYEVQNGKMRHTQTGQTLDFEILLVQPTFERIVGPFVKNLEQLGIDATVRTVDTAQYQNRLDQFDFDMVVTTWGQSLSPGNEQRDFWSSEAANTPGSRNLAGIESEAVDALIQEIITAESRDALITATRALDRVLLWGHYVIPHWHTRVTRIAYWDMFGLPETMPVYGVDLFAWWVDPDKAAARERAPAVSN